MVVPPKIAVIGAGAAGLCTTRVIHREMGVNPTVLEAKPFSGGVWRYEPSCDTNPMYRDLKTNRPKELMGYREKPWNGPGDSFVPHHVVQEYLMEYQEEFDLTKHIQFSTPVTQLTILDQAEEGGGYSSLSPEAESWPRIKIDYGDNGKESDIFDAVFVCKGSFTTPSTPDIPGLTEYFHVTVLHSVSYDNPEEFEGQTILCVGGAASGTDLARDISQHAEQVYLSSPSCKYDDNGNVQSLGKVTWVPRTMQVLEDGTIQFDKGCKVKPKVDTIIFCSGYQYHFPFINKKSSLEFHCVPGERRVMPLYKQFWHAQYPNLCFMGIPHHIIPFPFFEFQAEAAVSQFKSFCLPDKSSRLAEASTDSISGGAKEGGSVQDTHFLGSAQWDYCRMMAKLGRVYNDDVESFISTNKAIYDDSERYRNAIFPGGPAIYRNNKYDRQGDNWKVNLSS